MVAKITEKFYLDPIEELDETLGDTWRALCDYFDACGELPDIRSLFMGVDFSRSRQAAEIVIANMLLDLSENISRFSPWYTRPSRAFGFSIIRDSQTRNVWCVLASEAVQKWEALIQPLSVAIRQNIGVIQAMIYVEKLIGDDPEDECVTARCECCPPHTIRVKKSALAKTEIFCSVCMMPFA